MSDELVNEKLVNDVKIPKSKVTEYKNCDICGGRYCNSTKSNHFNSDKHKWGIKIVEKEKIIVEKDKIIKELENKILTLTNRDNIIRKSEDLRLANERLNAQLNAQNKEHEYRLSIIDEQEKEIIELKNKIGDIKSMIS